MYRIHLSAPVDTNLPPFCSDRRTCYSTVGREDSQHQTTSESEASEFVREITRILNCMFFLFFPRRPPPSPTASAVRRITDLPSVSFSPVPLHTASPTHPFFYHIHHWFVSFTHAPPSLTDLVMAILTHVMDIDALTPSCGASKARKLMEIS
jgi:hypothetical protein